MIRRATLEKHIGQRYGRLTVLSFVRRYEKQYFYECRCDCGVTKPMRIGALQAGTISCGCYTKEQAAIANRGNTYRRLPTGQASMQSLYTSYRRGAEVRGLEFALSVEQFEELTKQNCFYCNAEPKSEKRDRFNNGGYTYNGIDRADNSIGYLPSNCLPCCKRCNSLKNGMTRGMVEKLYRFFAEQTT